MANVLKIFDAMTRSEQDAFLQLCMEPPNVAGWDPSTEHDQKIEAIFKTNEFGTGEVFELASRFNHSCSSNLNHTGHGGKRMFYARRDIKMDEELTISYIHEGLPLDERQLELGRWFPKCRCVACDGSPASIEMEEKRAEIGELEKELGSLPDVVDRDGLGDHPDSVLQQILTLHVRKAVLLDKLCFRPLELSQRYFLCVYAARTGLTRSSYATISKCQSLLQNTKSAIDWKCLQAGILRINFGKEHDWYKEVVIEIEALTKSVF